MRFEWGLSRVARNSAVRGIAFIALRFDCDWAMGVDGEGDLGFLVVVLGVVLAYSDTGVAWCAN